MINVHFKKGDRVRVVKSCDADLPIGYETWVNDVLNYHDRDHIPLQRLSLFDRVGDERDRPGNEFELVERPTVVERAYAAADLPRGTGKVAELGMAYGGRVAPSPDIHLETVNRALAARVRQLEEAIKPFLFRPEDFHGFVAGGGKAVDIVSTALDANQPVTLHWPMPGDVDWVSFITIGDFRRVREVLSND